MFRCNARSLRHVLLAAVIIGVVAAPLAVASASGIQGGQRNPSSNPSISYHRETQIIASVAQGEGGVAAGTGGFATRQSNKSDSGGGAIYGCRARAGTDPCVEAVNLSTGHAFEFLAGGGADAVGKIWFGPDFTKPVSKPPFITNATGLVRNLNADMVGGEHASQLVNTGQLLFAVVDAAGHLGSNRGATAAALNAASGSGSTGATGATGPTGPSGAGVTSYTVTFGGDVSKCALTATPASVSAGSVAAAPGPAAAGGAVHEVVVTESGSATGFSLQVTC